MHECILIYYFMFGSGGSLAPVSSEGADRNLMTGMLMRSFNCIGTLSEARYASWMAPTVPPFVSSYVLLYFYCSESIMHTSSYLS